MVKSLNDLNLTGLFSFYGVVTFIKVPQKTRGPDYSMTLRVTDPTWKDDPLCCLLFGKTLEFFPKVERPGDLVRFHRVRMSRYNGKLQCQSAPGFAAVVFKDGLSDPIATTKHFSFADEEKKIVKNLQEWARKQTFAFAGARLPGPPDHDDYTIDCIANIKMKKYFNLKCQVIAIREFDDTQVNFKVWDGTKPPKRTGEPGKDLSVPVAEMLPVTHPELLWEEDLKKGLKDLQKYIVDVTVFDDHVPASLKIKPGDFIQFTNLHSLVPASKWGMPAAPHIELCLHYGKTFNRGLQPLTAEESKMLEERMKPILKSRRGNTNDDGTPRTRTLVKSPTMSEFSVNTYFNFRCQVVAMWHMSPTQVVLKVVDGTKPPAHLTFLEVMPNDPEDVTWFEEARYCVGGHTLDISIFDDHAEQIDKIDIKPGELVLLRNLHVFLPKKKDGQPDGASAEAIEICLHGGKSHNRGLFRTMPSAGLEIIRRVEFLMKKLSGQLSDSCFDQSQSQSQHPSQENAVNPEQVVKDSQEPSTSWLGPSPRKRAKIFMEPSDFRCKTTVEESLEVDSEPSVRTTRSSAEKSIHDSAKKLDAKENDRLVRLKSPAAKRTDRPVVSDYEQTDKSSTRKALSEPLPSSQLAVSTIAKCTKLRKDGNFDKLIRIKARVADISTEYASKAFILFCKNCNFMSHFPQKQHRLIPSSNSDARTKILDDIFASVATDHQQELVYYELKCASVDDFELLQDMLFIRKAKRMFEPGERLTGTSVCHGAWMEVMNAQQQQSDGSVKYVCPICSDGQSAGSLLNRMFLVTFTVHDFSGDMQVAWIKNMDKFYRQPDLDDTPTPEDLTKAYTLLSTMTSLDKPLFERPLLDLTLELMKKDDETQAGAKIVKCCGRSINMTLNSDTE
ncbi:uncharacterized protein LOC135493664 [Lineus longissimus]|uniref:uncharacterized protein LOC135493664 n=1 Tax=Lineus longissimus TaxID=88925 RepID=UPI00315C594F